MTTLLRRVAAVVAAAAAVLAVGGASTAHATDTDGPSYQAPTKGECHAYGFSTYAAESDTSPAVPCTRPHTARTIAVVTLPADLTWPQDDAEKQAFYDQLSARVLPSCASAYRRELGARWKAIAKTAYTWSFYWPTATQQQHGARWLRCDINLRGGTKLQTLHGTRVKLGRVTKNEQACITVRKSGAWQTGCNARHQFRAEKIVRAPFKQYGSSAKWGRLARRSCSSLGSSWYATWASRSEWAVGDHFLTCYGRTTH